MKNIYYVYQWTRLDTNEVFYVGKGKEHRAFRKQRGNNLHFNRIAKNYPCAVVMLRENLNEEDAREYEIRYIKYYRDVLGFDLVNLTDGGEGISGYKPTPEEIKRNRERINGFDIYECHERIIDLYVNENMSTRQIANIYNISKNPIMRVLRKHNITPKTRKTCSKLKDNGLLQYKKKCILVKDINANDIAYFETGSYCGQWLANLGILKNKNSGKKKVCYCLQREEMFNGFKFVEVSEEIFLKNRHIKSDLDLNKYVKDFSEKNIIVEVYDQSGILLETYKDILDCCNWLVENKIHCHISASRKAINKYSKPLEKYKFYYKKYSNTEYHQSVTANYTQNCNNIGL